MGLGGYKTVGGRQVKSFSHAKEGSPAGGGGGGGHKQIRVSFNNTERGITRLTTKKRKKRSQ